MKNLSSIILVLLVAMAMAAQGQKIGIRAGYQSSSWHINGSQVSGTDPLNNFYVGIFKDNKIIPVIHMGLGLEYFQNGVKLSNGDKHVLNYLSIPLYAKAQIGPVFTIGGLGANIKISEKILSGGTVSSPTDEQKSNALDVPFFLGAGVKIFIFTVEARYHWGMIDINHGAHNQYLQIGASVSI
jgi:hypothetical protein